MIALSPQAAVTSVVSSPLGLFHLLLVMYSVFFDCVFSNRAGKMLFEKTDWKIRTQETKGRDAKAELTTMLGIPGGVRRVHEPLNGFQALFSQEELDLS